MTTRFSQLVSNRCFFGNTAPLHFILKEYRKWCLLLLFGFLSNIGFSQVYDTTTYQGKVDYMLQLINKEPITSDVLYERVIPFARLHDFKPGSTDTTSSGHFLQAISEIGDARYSKNLNFGIPDAAIETSKAVQNLVSVGVLYYDYQSIDTNSVEDSLITLNVQNLWVKNGTSSIFKNNIAFVAGGVHGTIDKSKPLKFIYNPNWFVTNKVNNIVSVQILVPGGDWQNISLGDTLNVNLTVGTQTLNYKIKVVFDDGSSLQQNNSISISTETESTPKYFERPDDDLYWANTYFPDCESTIVAQNSYRGYDETVARFGQGKVYFYLRQGQTAGNCGYNRLRKPLIFVDGFDPLDTRKGQAIYGKYLAFPNNGDLDVPILVGDELRSNLPNRGYDIIILNLPRWTDAHGTVDGGTDFIQRNVEVLITLINNINAGLQSAGSTEKIVIIGPSMGGLISRYALAKMEKQGQNHNCRTWISFDSPHMGANIPIGVQQFIQFWSENGTNESKSKSRIARDSKINSVAAKQMLLHHYLSNSIPTAPAQGFRSTFLADLESNGLPGSFGWPKLVNRKLAIVNGSGTGLPLTTIGCQEALYMKIFLHTRLGVVTSLLRPITALIDNQIEVGNSRIRFTGSNTGCTVFNGYYRNVSVNHQGFGGFSSLDAAPGGTFNAFEEAGSAARSGMKSLFNTNSFTRFVRLWYGDFKSSVDVNLAMTNHCFIPTKSALGYGISVSNGMGNLNENISSRNLVCSKETPFDAYYAPNTNEPHVSMNANSYSWLLNQLEINTTTPVLVPFNIVSNDAVLSGSSINFTATTSQTFPHPIIYFWSVTDRNGISSSSINNATNQSSQVTATGNGTFKINVSVQFVDPGGNLICLGNQEKVIRVINVSTINRPNIQHDRWNCNGISYTNPKEVFCAVPPGLAPGLELVRYNWQIAGAFDGYIYGPGCYEATTTSNGQHRILVNNANFANQRHFAEIKLEHRPQFPGTNFPNGHQLFLRLKAKPLFRFGNFEFEGLETNVMVCTLTVGSMIGCLPPIDPNPPVVVYANAQSVELNLPEQVEGLTPPINVNFIDSRKVAVFKYTSATAFPFEVHFTELLPGSYAIQCTDANGLELNGEFHVASHASSKLFVSPNPTVLGIDDSTHVRLVNPPSHAETYKFTLANDLGQAILHWEGQEHTMVEVGNLTPGIYEVTVTDGEEIWQEQLEFLQKGSPYLTLLPNPASTDISVVLNNPVYESELQSSAAQTKVGEPGKGLLYNILHNGITVLSGETADLNFTENISHLPPGFYIVSATDGLKWYNKHFVIIH